MKGVTTSGKNMRRTWRLNDQKKLPVLQQGYNKCKLHLEAVQEVHEIPYEGWQLG